MGHLGSYVDLFTLTSTKLLFNPKRYDEYHCPFYKGVPPGVKIIFSEPLSCNWLVLDYFKIQANTKCQALSLKYETHSNMSFHAAYKCRKRAC